jgi:predicted Zn-dependent protease
MAGNGKMRLMKFHLRIPDSSGRRCGSCLPICARTVLYLAFLALFAVTCSLSQEVTGLPPNSDAGRKQYQTGVALVRSGQIDKAISAFKIGLEVAPGDKVLLDATGAAYSLKGDLKAAQEYFIESLRQDPDFVPAKQNLGITLFGLGRYAEAEEQFKGLQNHAGQPGTVANLFLGMIAEKQGDCEAGAPLMENAGALVFQYADAVLSFARCEYQIGDLQRATQLLLAFDRAQESPAQYEQAADLYTHLGQSQRALEELSKAHSGKDQDADAEMKRAVLLEKAGRLKEAQIILENLAASAPSGDVMLDLARVAEEREDFGVAMKALKRASQLEPAREDSYLEFSTICEEHGNDTLALETDEIGLSHVPNSYRLTVQKGAVLEKLGHFSDAERVLQQAMGMQKDNSIALVSLAVVQAHSGRPNEAEDTLANAVRQFPDNYYMYYFRGRLLSQFAGTDSSKSELREGAKRSLEESIRLNPTYADSYYQLSELYLPAESKLSEQALQKCLQLDPTHLAAKYSLARLYLRTGRKEQGQALLATFKAQQRAEELQQDKQLRIDIQQK